MEGILLELETILSPFAVLSGLALLVIGVSGISLVNMASKEADGREVFRAESPFSDVRVEEPAERIPLSRAA